MSTVSTVDPRFVNPNSLDNQDLVADAHGGTAHGVAGGLIAQTSTADNDEQPVGTIPGMPTALTFAAAAQNSDGAPALPDVSGVTRSSLAQAGTDVAPWLQGATAFTMAETISVLTDVAITQALTAGRAKTLANNMQISMQKQSQKAQIDQVKGEQASALTKFFVSVAATGVAAYCGFQGAKLSFNAGMNNVQAGRGFMLTSVAQTVGTCVNAAGDAVDKLLGGQHKADQAKIEKALLDIYVAIWKSYEETENAHRDESNKRVDSALELQTQLLQSVAQSTSGIINRQ